MLVEFGRSEGFPFVSAARFFERGLHSIYAICVLGSAWLEGKDGGLPGREQAEAWALREMWRDAGKVHK